MKANELRIGNFIQANGPMMEVRAIYEDHIELYLHGSEADNWDENLDVCEGVPLTPEILEKCGFEEHEIGYKIETKNFWFIIYFYDSWKIDYEEKENYGDGKCALSGYWNLHQLQNIYYALTGIELQFTHPKQTQV